MLAEVLSDEDFFCYAQSKFIFAESYLSMYKILVKMECTIGRPG